MGDTGEFAIDADAAATSTRRCFFYDSEMTDERSAKRRERLRPKRRSCPPTLACDKTKTWRRCLRRRVAIGICANMRLRGYFTLGKSRTRAGVELGCEKYFGASTMQNAPFALFAATLSGAVGLPTVVQCRSTSVNFYRSDKPSDQTALHRAWSLLRPPDGSSSSPPPDADATMEILCSRVVSATGGSGGESDTMLRPAILASSLPYAQACAVSIAAETKGESRFVLGTSGVAAIFELVRIMGQSLYLCIMTPSPEDGGRGRAILPWGGEKFSDYTVRLWASEDRGAFPAISLVHCMIDCDPGDAWKFYGMPSEIVDQLLKLVASTGMMATMVRDGGTQRQHEWQALRLVLPAIHIGMHPGFGEAVSSDATQDSGDEDGDCSSPSPSTSPRGPRISVDGDPEMLPDAASDSDEQPKKRVSPRRSKVVLIPPFSWSSNGTLPSPLLLPGVRK